MGQKVNPNGFRVGVIKNWDSRWFVKDSVFGDTLVEDYNLRKYLKKTLYSAGVPKIEIERDASKVRIHIHCAKPGVVIGRNGSEIEKLRETCEKMLGKKVLINIVEVKKPRYQRYPRCREHCCSVRETYLFPSCNETRYGTCNASWRKGYQNSGFGSFGRC